jgi:cell division protein ZapE
MGLEQDFQSRITSGALKPDLAQVRVMNALADLSRRLTDADSPGFLKSLFGGKREAVRGLYIHGEVGRGKTMLMDLFFANLAVEEKRRVHFHAFMQDVHAARAKSKSGDVIASIADGFAKLRILCLDEMQIVDIADAMIIGRLYEALLARGVSLVTTSNVPPEDLYREGLNRQLFVPFIKKLRETLDVIALDSAKDYRLNRVKGRDTYLDPMTAETRAAFDRLWYDLTDGDGDMPAELDVLGRKLCVPAVARGCARFTFDDLCRAPLGPSDFLAISKGFRTVFVDGVPDLQEHERNEAKRFILMIDTFYDAGTRLVVLAEVPIEDIFPMTEHAFESKRTISRLKEMQSASWWGRSVLET